MERRQWLAERPPHSAAAAAVPEPNSEDAAVAPTTPTAPPPKGSARFRAVDRIRAKLQTDLSVEPSAAARGQLSMTVRDRTGKQLTVCIERARDGASYFRANPVLGLWYPSDADAIEPEWSVGVLEAAGSLLLSGELDDIAAELSEDAGGGTASDGHTVSHKPASYPPQIPLRAAAPPPSTPRESASDLAYKRDVVLGPRDVESFFHVDYEYEDDTEVDQPPTCRIGVIYQCNQTCTFCQLAEMNTHIPPSRIYAALDASRARGATRVIITGGEPTMCSHLGDYITYAREHGFTTIEMQSNAIVLDKLARAQALRDAGLTDAQISLHGPDSEISDHLTAAPGTHERTLDGVGNLLEVGVRVLLNHLIFRDNQHLLIDYVDMVERRWGAHRDQLILQFHAPMNEFARIEHARTHIARYTDYAPKLLEAIDKARNLGYRVQDLGDPTGIPALCVLEADSKYLGPILSQHKKPRFHRWESDWVARVPACATCDLRDSCMGIPKAYLAVHGDAEFRPVKLPA